MPPNQSPWPRRWLMTDERMGDGLWAAMRRLPRGSGVIVRHDSLGRKERARLAARVARICRRRGLLLGVAGDVALARRVKAALVHRPKAYPGAIPASWPVHDKAEASRARRMRAALVFVSPIYPTLSHHGATALGLAKARRLARLANAPAIALGGMSEKRFKRLGGTFHGYAGIDCWLVEPARSESAPSILSAARQVGRPAPSLRATPATRTASASLRSVAWLKT